MSNRVCVYIFYVIAQQHESQRPHKIYSFAHNVNRNCNVNAMSFLGPSTELNQENVKEIKFLYIK